MRSRISARLLVIGLTGLMAAAVLGDLVVVAVRASPSGGPAARQASGINTEDVAVRVYLEEVDAHLGSLFTTPVHLETLEEIRLSSLTFQIAYPAEFSFEKAHPGYQLSSSRLAAEAKTEDTPDGLKVTTISIEAGQGEGALPDGLILYLDFRVAEKVESRMVTLQNTIVRAETVDGEALPRERLLGEEQGVYILRSDMLPVVACFFYMH